MMYLLVPVGCWMGACWAICRENVRACFVGESPSYSAGAHLSWLRPPAAAGKKWKGGGGTRVGQAFQESRRSWMCWPSWNDIFLVWKEMWVVGNLQMNECTQHNDNIVSKIIPHCMWQQLLLNGSLCHLHQLYPTVRLKAGKNSNH